MQWGYGGGNGRYCLNASDIMSRDLGTVKVIKPGAVCLFVVGVERRIGRYESGKESVTDLVLKGIWPIE